MSRFNVPRGRIRIHSIGHEEPGFLRKGRRTGARRRGELYEQRVHQDLEARYGCFVASMWFHFSDSEGSKWCQPDGLLFDPWRGRITICEVKYQHTPKGYEQLFDIYEPVVKAAFPEYPSVVCVEIVRWFDPAVSTQARPHLCEEISRAKPFAFNVHILTP